MEREIAELLNRHASVIRGVDRHERASVMLSDLRHVYGYQTHEYHDFDAFLQADTHNMSHTAVCFRDCADVYSLAFRGFLLRARRSDIVVIVTSVE
jgi:hypothetical protein